MWAARGMEDVSFQRGAQITWWSVLGGLAVAALLTQLGDLRQTIASGQWHYLLFFFASCLIIVNSWVQTAWGSLVLRWPVNIPTSLAVFFQGLSLSVASLNVTRPAAWAAAMFVVLLTAVANQLFFMMEGGWVAMPASMVARARAGIRIYLAFAGIALASAIHLALRPSPTVEILWGVVSLLGSIFALVRQHQGMELEKRSMGVA
ncbi:MAG TPA: hypothetical protein VFI11_00290 [Anaerolineales bacterium]|nr:hypothetical protein [Anaerolineales bacterium]